MLTLPLLNQEMCVLLLAVALSVAKPKWRSVGQSGQHRQSLKITADRWSGSSSRSAIA